MEMVKIMIDVMWRRGSSNYIEGSILKNRHRYITAIDDVKLDLVIHQFSAVYLHVAATAAIIL